MNTRTISFGLVSLALAAAVSLSGCAGSASSRPGPYVKPGLVMIPADQVKYYQPGSRSEAPPTPGFAATDTRGVQTDSQVTAIQFNRYADPARPSELMHEAHIVYRRESGPQWRLTAPAREQQILIGPQMTDGRGEIKGLAAPELDSYLREQRTTLRRQEETISNITATLRQLAEQQKQLAEQLSRADAAHNESPAAPSAEPKAAPVTQPSSPPARIPLHGPPAPAAEGEVSEIPER